MEEMALMLPIIIMLTMLIFMLRQIFIFQIFATPTFLVKDLAPFDRQIPQFDDFQTAMQQVIGAFHLISFVAEWAPKKNSTSEFRNGCQQSEQRIWRDLASHQKQKARCSSTADPSFPGPAASQTPAFQHRASAALERR